MTDYDVIIIGGGPAGLTAGLYTARAGFKTLLIEQMAMGGTAATTDILENYPGFPNGIGGAELGQLMAEQAARFGMESTFASVSAIASGDKETGHRVIAGDKQWSSATVVIASGTEPSKLGIPGESEFRGQGVSYCATCDGAFFREQEIAVVGGGDSAVKEAIFLTRFAKKVHLVHRRDRLRASKVLQERAFANDKMEFQWKYVPVEIMGGPGGVSGIRLKHVDTGEEKEISVTGVFFYVGLKPLIDFVPDSIEKDENGFIITDEDRQTNITGIYAAGDVCRKSLRQVATAVGDGAAAAGAIQEYLVDY
jgi:thioredoxin reductase (NADPH)